MSKLRLTGHLVFPNKRFKKQMLGPKNTSKNLGVRNCSTEFDTEFATSICSCPPYQKTSQFHRWMNPSIVKPARQVMFEAGVSGISFPDATLGVSSLPPTVVEQHFGQSRGCSEFFEVLHFGVLI